MGFILETEVELDREPLRTTRKEGLGRVSAALKKLYPMGERFPFAKLRHVGDGMSLGDGRISSISRFQLRNLGLSKPQQYAKSRSLNSEGCGIRENGRLARRDEGEYPRWVFGLRSSAARRLFCPKPLRAAVL